MIGNFYEALKIIHKKDSKQYSKAFLNLLEVITQKEIPKDQIILNLTTDGLQLLFDSIYDKQDRILRKLSAKLICELAYKNELAQNMICEYFSFTPIQGKVSINQIPESLCLKMKNNHKLFAEIKSNTDVSESNKRYWSYPKYKINKGMLMKAINNLQMSLEYANHKQNQNLLLMQIDLSIPDPLNYLIGFFLIDKQPTETKYKNKFNSSSIYQQPKRKKPQNYSVELAVLNEGHSDRQSKLFKSASPSPQKPVVKSKFNQTHLYFQQLKEYSESHNPSPSHKKARESPHSPHISKSHKKVESPSQKESKKVSSSILNNIEENWKKIEQTNPTSNNCKIKLCSTTKGNTSRNTQRSHTSHSHYIPTTIQYRDKTLNKYEHSIHNPSISNHSAIQKQNQSKGGMQKRLVSYQNYVVSNPNSNNSSALPDPSSISTPIGSNAVSQIVGYDGNKLVKRKKGPNMANLNENQTCVVKKSGREGREEERNACDEQVSGKNKKNGSIDDKENTSPEFEIQNQPNRYISAYRTKPKINIDRSQNVRERKDTQNTEVIQKPMNEGKNLRKENESLLDERKMKEEFIKLYKRDVLFNKKTNDLNEVKARKNRTNRMMQNITAEEIKNALSGYSSLSTNNAEENHNLFQKVLDRLKSRQINRILEMEQLEAENDKFTNEEDLVTKLEKLNKKYKETKDLVNRSELRLDSEKDPNFCLQTKKPEKKTHQKEEKRKTPQFETTKRPAHSNLGKKGSLPPSGDSSKTRKQSLPFKKDSEGGYIKFHNNLHKDSPNQTQFKFSNSKLSSRNSSAKNSPSKSTKPPHPKKEQKQDTGSLSKAEGFHLILELNHHHNNKKHKTSNSTHTQLSSNDGLFKSKQSMYSAVASKPASSSYKYASKLTSAKKRDDHSLSHPPTTATASTNANNSSSHQVKLNLKKSELNERLKENSVIASNVPEKKSAANRKNANATSHDAKESAKGGNVQQQQSSGAGAGSLTSRPMFLKDYEHNTRSLYTHYTNSQLEAKKSQNSNPAKYKAKPYLISNTQSNTRAHTKNSSIYEVNSQINQKSTLNGATKPKAEMRTSRNHTSKNNSDIFEFLQNKESDNYVNSWIGFNPAEFSPIVNRNSDKNKKKNQTGKKKDDKIKISEGKVTANSNVNSKKNVKGKPGSTLIGNSKLRMSDNFDEAGKLGLWKSKNKGNDMTDAHILRTSRDMNSNFYSTMSPSPSRETSKPLSGPTIAAGKNSVHTFTSLSPHLNPMYSKNYNNLKTVKMERLKRQKEKELEKEKDLKLSSKSPRYLKLKEKSVDYDGVVVDRFTSRNMSTQGGSTLDTYSEYTINTVHSIHNSIGSKGLFQKDARKNTADTHRANLNLPNSNTNSNNNGNGKNAIQNGFNRLLTKKKINTETTRRKKEKDKNQANFSSIHVK